MGSFTISQITDPATGVLVREPSACCSRMDTHARLMRSDRTRAAFYLGDDLRSLIPVRPTELSVGFPTVRLEVSFGP